MQTPTRKPVHTPEALGILHDEALAGVGTSTIMRTLGPVIESRLEYFSRALEVAPADFNTLLDLRAKLAVLRGLKRELLTQIRRGGEAASDLEELYRK